MTPRPVGALTDAEVLAELRGLARLCVAALERGAALYAEAVRRGLTAAVRSAPMRDFLPAVAAGTLSAAAVVRFSDLGRLFRAVRALPPGEQDRLAAGGLVDVRVNGEVLPLTARETWPVWTKQVFFIPGRVATVAEQDAYLAAEAKRLEARRERAVQRAVRTLEREQAGTISRAVELLIGMGWRRTGGE